MASFYINTMMGSCLCLLFILIDYLHKYKTDFFQRKLFVVLIILALISSLIDFISRIFVGMPGSAAAIAITFFNTVFLIARSVTLYTLIVFLDYMLRKDIKRTKIIFIDISIVTLLYTVSVVLNLWLHYYFYVSEKNIPVRSDFFVISLIVTFFPLVLITIDVVRSRKYIKRSYMGMLLLFLFFITAGEIVDDFILEEGNIFWAFFAAGILSVYFFITQNDAKIDSLTEINNRFSFNEFISKISMQTATRSYSIALLDVDYFKKINDTYGHAEGDIALRDLAQMITTSIRRSDFTARYGGDEFIIVTDSPQSIETILGRIETAIKKKNLSGTKPYNLEVSYGFDVYTTNSNQNIDKFLDRIDKLMYAQKMAKRQ